jgi:hypothetical protein
VFAEELDRLGAPDEARFVELAPEGGGGGCEARVVERDFEAKALAQGVAEPTPESPDHGGAAFQVMGLGRRFERFFSPL